LFCWFRHSYAICPVGSGIFVICTGAAATIRR
jgi:hypothetical protein